MEQGKQKLLNPTFGLLLGSGLAYFVGMSMLFPTLPSYVISGLGGSNFQVGLAVGIMGISAVVLRLAGSGVVDIKGRRWTIVFGATTAALGHFLLIAASNIEIVTVARLLTGLGEAAYFVGLASAFGDLAPENRRAESASYFSAVLYLGFVIGPILGEQLQMQFSYRAVWIAAGSCCLAGALLGLAAPSAAHPHKPLRSKRLLHPAALLPAGVAVIGLWGFASFMAFAAPWATELGIGRASSVFLTFACVIMLLRIGLARLGDRLGARTMSSIALALSAGGLATIASWQNPAGLFVGIVNTGDSVEIVGIKETRKTVCTGVEMFRKILDEGRAGDNIGALLRGIGKTEVQRGQVLAQPGSITPHTKFEAEVYVLTKNEGGRHKPFFDGYRPQFYFRTTDVTGSIALGADVEMCMPGDNTQMSVELIAPIAMDEGLRFAIREGGRTVGAGAVTKIVE